jgi:hypothetical protein
MSQRLPRFPRYLEHARAIAAALEKVPGVRVIPDPPQTSMMHLLIETTTERYDAAVRALAAERGIWVWGEPMTTLDQNRQRFELTVGDATCELSADEVAAAIAALC